MEQKLEVVEFGKSKLNEANDAFAKKHGYDLRETKNSDKLVFDRYEIHRNSVYFYYKEITPHDRPYGIELVYDIKDVPISDVDSKILQAKILSFRQKLVPVTDQDTLRVMLLKEYDNYFGVIGSKTGSVQSS